MRASLAHPGIVIGIWLLAAAVCGVAVARLQIDTSTSSFLDRSTPEWEVYQRSLQAHGGDELVVVAIQGGQPFDPDALRRVLELTNRLQLTPGVRRVDSLATVPLIRSDRSGGVLLDPALSEDVLADEQRLEELRKAVRGDRIVWRSLISEDELTHAINVFLDEAVESDRNTIVREVRRLASGYAAKISGVPIFRTEVNKRTRTEVLLFVPVTIGLIGAGLFALFGTPIAVLVPLAVGGVGALFSLASMSLVGATLSLSTMVLPSILLALGCAYSMHIMTAARGSKGPLETFEAVQPVIAPVALSGATTAVGFFAMATVQITAIRELASFGGLGVVCLTVAALTFVPAMLVVAPLPLARGRGEWWIHRTLRPRIVRLATSHRTGVVAVWFVGLVVVGAGVARLEVATDIILWFPPHSEIRESYEQIRDRLSGITPINVLVESEDGAEVSAPEVVFAMNALGEAAERRPSVGKVLSVAQPLEQMHEAFNGPGAGLPGRQDLIEQYLLVLESVEQLGDLISPDRRSANLQIRVDDNASREIVQLGAWMEDWWRTNGPTGFRATTTGVMFEFGRAEEAIAYGQIRGLGLALVGIALILLGVFTSLRLALFALIPNVVPLMVAFGFMGWTGIPLDAATVCLGSLALGIAVDDTIHVVNGYRHARVRGASPEEAIDTCMRRVLPALVFTTFTVAVGFAALGLSEFMLIRNLGVLTAAVVILCLVADTTLLPALLSAAVRGDHGWEEGSR